MFVYTIADVLEAVIGLLILLAFVIGYGCQVYSNSKNKETD